MTPIIVITLVLKVNQVWRRFIWWAKQDDQENWRSSEGANLHRRDPLSVVTSFQGFRKARHEGKIHKGAFICYFSAI